MAVKIFLIVKPLNVFLGPSHWGGAGQVVVVDQTHGSSLYVK